MFQVLHFLLYQMLHYVTVVALTGELYELS